MAERYETVSHRFPIPPPPPPPNGKAGYARVGAKGGRLKEGKTEIDTVSERQRQGRDLGLGQGSGER